MHLAGFGSSSLLSPSSHISGSTSSFPAPEPPNTDWLFGELCGRTLPYRLHVGQRGGGRSPECRFRGNIVTRRNRVETPTQTRLPHVIHTEQRNPFDGIIMGFRSFGCHHGMLGEDVILAVPECLPAFLRDISPTNTTTGVLRILLRSKMQAGIDVV